jgi:hypothetical protein
MIRQGQVRDAQNPWDKQRLSTGTVSKGQYSPIARSALGPRERVLSSSPAGCAQKRQLFQGLDGGRTRARILDPLIKKTENEGPPWPRGEGESQPAGVAGFVKLGENPLRAKAAIKRVCRL